MAFYKFAYERTIAFTKSHTTEEGRGAFVQLMIALFRRIPLICFRAVLLLEFGSGSSLQQWLQSKPTERVTPEMLTLLLEGNR